MDETEVSTFAGCILPRGEGANKQGVRLLHNRLMAQFLRKGPRYCRPWLIFMAVQANDSRPESELE